MKNATTMNNLKKIVKAKNKSRNLNTFENQKSN